MELSSVLDLSSEEMSLHQSGIRGHASCSPYASLLPAWDSKGLDTLALWNHPHPQKSGETPFLSHGFFRDPTVLSVSGDGVRELSWEYLPCCCLSVTLFTFLINSLLHLSQCPSWIPQLTSTLFTFHFLLPSILKMFYLILYIVFF